MYHLICHITIYSIIGYWYRIKETEIHHWKLKRSKRFCIIIKGSKVLLLSKNSSLCWYTELMSTTTWEFPLFLTFYQRISELFCTDYFFQFKNERVDRVGPGSVWFSSVCRAKSVRNRTKISSACPNPSVLHDHYHYQHPYPLLPEICWSWWVRRNYHPCHCFSELERKCFYKMYYCTALLLQ